MEVINYVRQRIFDQEINDDELKDVANGDVDTWNNCYKEWERDIYGGKGFPNCASTVEEGSWYSEGDACLSNAIDCQGIEGCYISDCKKAWK